jgi:PhnB protein
MPEYTRMDSLERALADLPRAGFRARLKQELERRAAAMTTSTIEPTQANTAARQAATPQLRVGNAAAAIDFYTRAFGAREVMRFVAGSSIPHAELMIGSALVIVADEAPEYGYPSAERLGGSPVTMRLLVDDADAAVAQAVAAGARLVAAVEDQFYGDRSGRVVDPFGYTWTIAARKEELTVEEMYRRFAALGPQGGRSGAGVVREGFGTVTPYIAVHDVPALIDFTVRTFGATELGRTSGGGGGIHAEIEIGDSKLMIGGGSREQPWSGDQRTTAFHVYVPNVDEVFARSLEAGGTTIQEPTEMPYGERGCGVKDPAGNTWYIATAHGASYIPDRLHTVTVYLHPRRAEPVIAFLKRAFDAEELGRYASPDGVIQHASVRIGDSPIEMGEAQGPYQPMTTRFYLYVPNVDASYQRAINAGATSIMPPKDQPYGERVAGVKDAFGNEWFMARPADARG